MKFVGVRELRNRTGEVLEAVGRGERVVLTKRGKPFAVVARLHEDELEGFILGGRGRRNLSEPSLDFWNMRSGTIYDQRGPDAGSGSVSSLFRPSGNRVG